MSRLNKKQAALAWQLSRTDPFFHIREVQGVTSLQPKQIEICRELAKYDRVAVKACHGVGKTYVAARLVLWFGSTFPYSKIITTAPTARLVEKLLWEEINAGYRNSRFPLGGEMQTTQWKIDKNWFALGFSPKKETAADSGTASNFQGFHAPYIFIVFDEATGIPRSLWEQVKGMLTNSFVRFLAIGNPTSKNSGFYDCFSSRLWRKITISCFDSPNLTANGFYGVEDIRKELDYLDTLDVDAQLDRMNSYKVVEPALVTAKWVIEFAIELGLDHPLFRSKALAEFPLFDESALFQLEDVIAAQERVIKRPDDYVVKRRAFGVDPAYLGKDNTVITVLEDEKQIARHVLQKKRTDEVSGFIIRLAEDLPPVAEECVCTDTTGVGAGVSDNLRAAHEQKLLRAVPISVQFGSNPFFSWEIKPDQDRMDARYVNMKARIFGVLSKNIGKLQLLDHPIYQEELPLLRAGHDKKGRLQLESKVQFKERTKRKSPDDSDSLGLADLARTVSLPNINRQFSVWRA
jgi:phage terminase large subunit